MVFGGQNLFGKGDNIIFLLFGRLFLFKINPGLVGLDVNCRPGFKSVCADI